MRIVILGAGYVGRVSAACFAAFGAHVTVVDADAAKIARLRAGQVPIHEPELTALMGAQAAAGRLRFATGLAGCLDGADAAFIAVGTPSRRGDGRADLDYVFLAARQIAGHLPSGKFMTVVIKSTVPVGTAREVARLMAEVNPRAAFAVCSNPEFLREGSAIDDFMRPDRVVIGVEDARAAATLQALYRPLHLMNTPVVQTTPESAEMIKYASNVFLAAKIGFINEVADLCEAAGADVRVVAQAMGMDPRIGPEFLQAGPGFGGSCLPKDALAMLRMGEALGVELPIIENAVFSNQQRKHAMARRIIAACGGASGKRIAILGVTFKPNTDDVRESPALAIVPALQAAGALVQAFDPAGMEAGRALLAGVAWARDAYAAMDGADAVVIVTAWPEFRTLDFGRMKAALRTPLLIDQRNIYKPADVRAQGFAYLGIGQGTPLPHAGRAEARIA